MLDTYGMDDINTQAIRELTTEVDRVKQKVATNTKDMQTLSGKVSAIEDDIIITSGVRTLDSTIEITANNLTGWHSVSTDSIPEGYSIISIDVDTFRDGESNLLKVIPIAKNLSNGQIFIMNVGNSTTTVKSWRYTITYKKN